MINLCGAGMGFDQYGAPPEIRLRDCFLKTLLDADATDSTEIHG